MDLPITPPKGDEGHTIRFREAYERALPEALALSFDELLPIHLDVPTVVTTTLGALPEIRALRSGVMSLPGFDIAQFDKLESYAFALSRAHTLYLTASEPTDSLQELAGEGADLRDKLAADANALAQRGLLEELRGQDRRGAPGYKNLAVELQILSSMLLERWSTIQGKCAAQMSELERADELASEILRAVGLREQGPAFLETSSENRLRMFTLFMRCYQEARRAISYLRWDAGDVEEIIPSLYSVKGGGRRPRSGATDPAEPTPPVPPPVPPTQPGGQVTTPPTSPPANGIPLAPSPGSTATGMPGSNPFLK